MKRAYTCPDDEQQGGQVVLSMTRAEAARVARDLGVAAAALSRHAFTEHHGQIRRELLRTACRVLAFVVDLERRG